MDLEIRDKLIDSRQRDLIEQGFFIMNQRLNEILFFQEKEFQKIKSKLQEIILKLELLEAMDGE